MYPSIELLNLQQREIKDTRAQDTENAGRLEKTLESFNIPAKVQRVTHGPAVTRFELGLLSSGVGYTLQIVGQKGLNPTVASLIMSLESVVSVLAGLLILHQTLSGREALGCVLMFAAIVLAQLPGKGKV